MDRGVYSFVRTHKGYFGGNWEFLLPVPPTSLHFILKLHFKTMVQGKFVHYSFKERNRKTCHLEQTHKTQTANPKPGSKGVRGHQNTNWWGCLATKKSSESVGVLRNNMRKNYTTLVLYREWGSRLTCRSLRCSPTSELEYSPIFYFSNELQFLFFITK